MLVQLHRQAPAASTHSTTSRQLSLRTLLLVAPLTLALVDAASHTGAHCTSAILALLMLDTRIALAMSSRGRGMVCVLVR